MEACATCHPEETAGFRETAMAKSLSTSASAADPSGAFEDAFSHTRFEIRKTDAGSQQTWQRNGQQQSMLFQYRIGSGEHASGFLALVSGHLFQSSLSYYTSSHRWDLAPGYEQDASPDFNRPVTPECLACHTGQSRPAPNTLNTYAADPIASFGITCERCHGDTQKHLKTPVPGSIINPAKLPPAARDSVCEQCHLAGDVRIPNPGESIAEFAPGQPLEQVYTVYIAPHGPSDNVKVISHSEQLALSVCKRSSGDKLWCGTCHNPHQQPLKPAEYFRQRCLACHAATLRPAHAALEGCIGCHMPRRPAKDGGHTAFTDHRISRDPNAPSVATDTTRQLIAWREPEARLRNRNLALALVTAGLQDKNSAEVIEGFRMLNRLPADLQDDPEVLAALGSILLTAKEAGEAAKRFEKALALRPDYAPYEANVGAALLEAGDRTGAITHLERAVQLDPLLQKAVTLLAGAYQAEGDEARETEVLARFRKIMGIERGQ